jgi:hypothetical protein
MLRILRRLGGTSCIWILSIAEFILWPYIDNCVLSCIYHVIALSIFGCYSLSHRWWGLSDQTFSLKRFKANRTSESFYVPINALSHLVLVRYSNDALLTCNVVHVRASVASRLQADRLMAGQPSSTGGLTDPLGRSITTIAFPSSSSVAAEQQATTSAASGSNSTVSSRDRSSFLLARCVIWIIFTYS